MGNDNTPIHPNQFECYILHIHDETKRLKMAHGGETTLEALASATLELATHGPFPHEQLHDLIGRRVRVTILD